MHALRDVDLRALLVSYAFPPVGGAGVQRVAKLAKYLPRYGVAPAVLTAANPSVPLSDDSLLADLHPDLEVVRARTLEPSYRAKHAVWRLHASSTRQGRLARLARSALLPDPQVLWQPAAHAVLTARIARKRDDVVLLSAPPFSQFLLAPLARAAGLGVVLDYRDEWSTLRRNQEMARSALGDAVCPPLEAALLRRAHSVVTSTEESRVELLARFPFLDASRVVAIPNGFDPEDYPAELPSPPLDRFVVTYAGTVFGLTSARGLLGAVRRLHARHPELARLLRVRFVGRIVETELDAFDGMEAFGVERIGYVPHGRVLLELAASHLTVCILDDASGAERVYPAKLFELMHLGRPLLLLAPAHSAAARLAEGHGFGPSLGPRDEEAIASDLQRRLQAFRRGDYRLDVGQNAAAIGCFDRRALAARFAELLRDAGARARRRGS